MVINTVGKVVAAEGVLMILPGVVSLAYGEYKTAFWFSVVMTAAIVVGLMATYLIKPKSRAYFSKEGFVSVALAWIVLSLIGALPFVLSGEIPSFIDALFETVSGFTTTGASVIEDVTALSHGALIWRSFTHWVGGMGIIVFVVALGSKTQDRTMHVLRAEMPGPLVDKIVPRSKDTAKILYLIYVGITAALFIMLLFGGMTPFESAIHTFGTVGTGGFGIKSDSLAGYNSFIQWTIAVFMLLCGINFNVYFLIIIGKIKTALKSTELRVYLFIILAATVGIAFNVYSTCAGFIDTIKTAFFQVSSIITTTGFATADFNKWNEASKTILLLLMFIGGSAGSTAGGLKVSRFILLIKKIRSGIRHTLNPNTVDVIKFEGKQVDESTVNGVTSYFSIYMIIISVIFLLLSFNGFSIETNLSATVSCFNNIGPGLGAVGPMSSYAAYAPLSKLLLAAAMLLGRLEIYPLLILVAPSTWFKQ